MNKITQNEITEAVKISGVTDYTGNYEELGGGELNNTYKLEVAGGHIILRIAKYPDNKSLQREATALQNLACNRIPKLIYFDSEQRLFDKQWIMESYVPGKIVARLTPTQFVSLGALLAEVHKVSKESDNRNLWQTLLFHCERFGDEDFFISHPDARLRSLVHKIKEYCTDKQHAFAETPTSLVHSDATPSNILVQNDSVGLIDWELSSFRDPMSEFATVYYEDMEFNQGNWRIKITPVEKENLFAGYVAGGGIIDEERIRVWMNHDKMGAALFLYWRIHNSGRPATPSQFNQYKLDLENLTTSLENNL